MIVTKYTLPNGNVFIWLGTGGIWTSSKGVDNILVLEGGDVLFLKTIKEVSLWKDEVKEDIEKLSFDEFVKKYDVPNNRDLWMDLKEGVKMGSYPPFVNIDQKLALFRNMI